MQGVACSSCKHFDRETLDREVCKAYPDGIPAQILSGNYAHRTPFEGDNGIHWEPVPEMAFLAEEEQVHLGGDNADS